MKTLAILSFIFLGTAAGFSDSGKFRSLTVTSPEVPVESPFTVNMAAETNAATIISCSVYLDNQKYGQSSGPLINMQVSASLGRHRITVQCYDSSDSWTKQTFYVQVVALSGSNHSVDLNWNASTSANVVGYFVYRGTNSGGPFSRLNSNTTPNTWFTDSNVQSGRTYYYVTTARDSAGRESAYSNAARAVIPSD